MKILTALLSLKGNLFLVSIRLTVYTMMVIALTVTLYKLSHHYEGNFYVLEDYYGGLVAMFLKVSLVVLSVIFVLTYWLKLEEYNYALVGIQGFWLLLFFYLFLMGFESHTYIICF